MTALQDISIHALREEGDRFRISPGAGSHISIHALREEGDKALVTVFAVVAVISIHALREEGDSKNGEKHLRFCFIVKRSAQIWKSFSKNIQKTAAICTERLENMVRRRRKRGERFPFAPREQARRSARLRIQTGDAPRYARPWSYSCCPVDKTADCPDRGR